MDYNCVFCIKHERGEILFENKLAFAIYDGFPVSNGHILIIPKSHTSNFFDLSTEEQGDCIALLNKAKEFLDEEFRPTGYNVGININKSAGQTVWHSHIHLIPRYDGDVEEPRGGVRGVIPGKRNY